MSTLFQRNYRLKSGLEVKNLSVERGQRLILEHENLTIKPGELVLLRGPNGRGKSTLLRTLAGLLPFKSGSVYFDNSDCAEGGRVDLARSMAYLGHKLGIKEQFSCQQWIQSCCLVQGVGASLDHIYDALDAVELEPFADDPILWLSSGQRQRLALARLILMDRPFWIMDEPSVGLDARSVDILADLLNKHAANGGLVLAATHVDFGVHGRIFHLERRAV